MTKEIKDYFRSENTNDELEVTIEESTEARLDKAQNLFEAVDSTNAFNKLKDKEKFVNTKVYDKNGSPDLDSLTVKGKLAWMLQTRAIKKNSKDSFVKLADAVISDMYAKINLRNLKTSILLRSGPGAGKTSITKKISRLLGLPIFIIEAPHVTKENLINIPFIVTKDFMSKAFNSTVATVAEDDKNDKNDVNVNGTNMDLEIVKAETNLVTMIKKFQRLKKNDETWERGWKKDSQMRAFMTNPTFNALDKIKSIRASYSCILFIDEYFRADNNTVRNILRNILNGRIGNDIIPEGTYTIFATNDQGSGVNAAFANEEFQSIALGSPSATSAAVYNSSVMGYKFDASLFKGNTLEEQLEAYENWLNEQKTKQSEKQPNELEDDYDERTSEEKTEEMKKLQSEFEDIMVSDNESPEETRKRVENEIENKKWAQSETVKDGLDAKDSLYNEDLARLNSTLDMKKSFIVSASISNFTKKFENAKGEPFISGPNGVVSGRRMTEITKLLTCEICDLEKAEDKESALRGIFTFIKRNFYFYLGSNQGGYDVENINSFINEITKGIVKIYPELDQTITILKSNKNMFFEAQEWQESLDFEFKSQMKMGSVKSYIPILAGIPGLGKTSVINNVAKRSKPALKVISIDCSSLDADSATGLINMEINKKNKKLEVNYTESNLFMDMMSQINRHILTLKANDPNWKRENQRYNFIMFFDEFNRVEDIKVFNAIRKVLLDKTFGNEKYFIPKDVMLMAAINPEDEGVMELTEHVTDVVNIIESKPSWSKIKSYLLERYKKSSKFYDDSENMPEGLGKASESKFPGVLLNSIYEKNIASVQVLGSNTDENFNPLNEDEKPFYLQGNPDSGENFVYYMSPRAIDNWLRKALFEISDSMLTAGLTSDYSFKNNDELEEFCKIITEEVLTDEVNVLPHWVDSIKKYAKEVEGTVNADSVLKTLQGAFSSDKNKQALMSIFTATGAKSNDIGALFAKSLGLSLKTIKESSGSEQAIREAYEKAKADVDVVANSDLLAYFRTQMEEGGDGVNFAVSFENICNELVTTPYLNEKNTKYKEGDAFDFEGLNITYATKLYLMLLYTWVSMVKQASADETLQKSSPNWQNSYYELLLTRCFVGFKDFCMSIFKSKTDQIYKLIDDPEDEIEFLVNLKSDILNLVK